MLRGHTVIEKKYEMVVLTTIHNADYAQAQLINIDTILWSEFMQNQLRLEPCK